MNLCRICLTSNPEKDLCDLETVKKGVKTTYTHVMKFCLGIQVANSKVSRKLCKKCFSKTLRYYEFKTLALQSEVYLESLPSNVFVKLEDVDCNPNFENNDCSQDTKSEMINLKEECKLITKDDSSNNVKPLNHTEHILEDETNALVKKQYQRTKTKRSKLTPQSCQQYSKTVNNIKDHIRVHISQSDGLTIECDVCGKVFTTKCALIKHHRLDHNVDVAECCSICNKVVKNLKIHQKIAHNKSSLRHVCPSCDKRFISRSVLNTHMMIHMMDRPFECDLCAAKFKQKILLAEHIRQVHNKERPHLCQFCSKSFYKGHHLKVHIRTHTKEKPYKCDECERTFRCIPALNKHKMIHSDAKNYACKLCNKTFARNCYLTHHMLSHTKEKRHACKYCGAMFGRSDNRKRHEYVTHERNLSGDHQTASMCSRELSESLVK